jgi:hypothetical protein
MRRATQIASIGLLAWACAGCVAMGISKDPYDPHVDPADFRTPVDNPYFPLVPGTTLTLSEKSGRDTSENEIEVTHDTKMIMGVKCVVVHDTVTLDGELKEDTYDWYAPDRYGNVWYFGEDTKEFKAGGGVSTEGSWEAGVKGAKPGIIMPGQPKVGGEPYYQEYGAGVAEDMGQIAALDESVMVPFGSFTGCVRTLEWSMLEPGTEKKWYCKGVGCVREESSGGDVATLVSVTRP